jgi:cyanophycin synthetase
MRALADMVSRVPAQRRILLMSQAGDRSDADIRELVRAACEMQPDRLLTCDLPGYERGREPGTIPSLIREFAVNTGLAAEQVRISDDPVSAVSDALDDARPGDLLVLLALTQREAVLELVRAFTVRQTVPNTPTV